jgi:hypothetical protein
MHKAKALWHRKTHSELTDLTINHIEKDELVVESEYSFISLGTEKTMITSELSEETAKKMRIPYMQGNFHDDFTYGYSLVGKIKEGPKNLMNQWVHVMHPHQDIIKVGINDVFQVPEGVSPKTATLASNMETAINAIWDAEVGIGDEILVIGFGSIGALVALLANSTIGIKLSILEINPTRRKIAESYGFNVVDSIETGNFDVVFNTSGSADMLQKGLVICRNEGKVIELSWYGNRQINLSLGEDFHYGRKQIISSQVSNIPLKKQGLWNYLKRKKLAFELLKQLHIAPLFNLEIPFLESPLFFNKLRQKNLDALAVVIKY